MLEVAKPGVRESDIYAAAMKTSAENACFTAAIALGSGPEFVGWGTPAWLYRPEEPRIIEEGDIVLAEVFCSFGMLETQHQPAIAIGEVHPDFEKAAELSRKSYLAGVKALKDGATFGSVVEAMKIPFKEVEECWQVHPLIHSMNPYGLIGVGEKMLNLPEVKEYGTKVAMIPNLGYDTVLKSGMIFAFEPNCGIGKKVVNLGGTVIVGENGGIELNKISTKLMRKEVKKSS
jgi:Xaa-Pro aminopeptidase